MVLRSFGCEGRQEDPLTLKNFEDFFARLPGREETERSWTIDLTARKDKARADAKPFRDTAREKSEQAEPVKTRLGELKKAKPRDDDAVADTEKQLGVLVKESREATAKADAIENAVYDLKAVNPNRKANVDTRTPDQLLDLIETKGREIADALVTLRQRSNTRPAQ